MPYTVRLAAGCYDYKTDPVVSIHNDLRRAILKARRSNRLEVCQGNQRIAFWRDNGTGLIRDGRTLGPGAGSFVQMVNK